MRCEHHDANRGRCRYDAWWDGRCYLHDKEDNGVAIAPNGGVSEDLFRQLHEGERAEEQEWARYSGLAG